MSRSKGNAQLVAKRGANYLLLVVVVLLFVGPIHWMVSESLKSLNEILVFPTTIIPTDVRWENYQKIFELQPFLRQFGYSLLVMAAVCALTLVLSVPAGYALAKV